MSSELTDDDKRRIQSFCETPPHDRSPEDLTPGREYADGDESSEDEARSSLVRKVVHRLRNR